MAPEALLAFGGDTGGEAHRGGLPFAAMVLWIVLGVIAVLLLYVIVAFNLLVRDRNRVDSSWSGIDVQLRLRYDLIPNLVETVRAYAAHERQTFEAVTRARAQAQQAQGVRDQAQAENQVTAGLTRLMAVAEAYPQLKANQNFLALQEELTGVESKIAFARQFYNDQVQAFNTRVQSFPSNVVAGLFRFRPREFFEIEEPARGPVAVGEI